jgi:Ca2+-binding EF-hand superfamily protein
MNNFVKERDQYLFKMFQSLDKENKGYLENDQCKELVKHFIEIEKGAYYIEKVDLDKFVDRLDNDRSGRITFDEFLKFFDLYEIMMLESDNIQKE